MLGTAQHSFRRSAPTDRDWRIWSTPHTLADRPSATLALFSDSGQGIAVSGTNAYVAGYMTAPDMLTTSGAFQTTLGAAGATNAFVADLPLTPTISVSPTSIPFGTQLVATPSQPQYVTITNNTSNPIGLTLPPTSTNPQTLWEQLAARRRAQRRSQAEPLARSE